MLKNNLKVINSSAFSHLKEKMPHIYSNIEKRIYETLEFNGAKLHLREHHKNIEMILNTTAVAFLGPQEFPFKPLILINSQNLIISEQKYFETILCFKVNKKHKYHKNITSK